MNTIVQVHFWQILLWGFGAGAAIGKMIADIVSLFDRDR